MLTRRKFPRSYMALLHFDYPYPGAPGDGLRDEIGKVTWTRVGTPKWVGSEAPVDQVVPGTPRFGYRCPQFGTAVDYIQGDNPEGVWNLSSSGNYEFDFWYRPTALNVAAGFFELRDAGGAVLLSAGHDAAGKLRLATGAAWGNLNLLETAVSLQVNTWHHLVLRVGGGTAKVFQGGAEKISGTLPPNITLTASAARIGQGSGQIDEFRARSEVGTGTPAVPTRPYAASIDLASLGGFGDGSLGDKVFGSGTTQINTYAPVTACDAVGQVLTVGAQAVGAHGALAVGQEIMIHVSQMKSGGPQEDLGRYALRRITALSGGILTLDKPVTAAEEFNLAVDATAYLCQVISIPHYKTLTVDAAATLVPAAWDGATGGMLACKTTGDCNVQGKLLSVSKGITRIDALTLLHSDMTDRCIMTGNVWIVCGGTLTATEAARIGAEWTGEAKGGTPGPANSGAIPGKGGDGGAGFGGGGGGGGRGGGSGGTPGIAGKVGTGGKGGNGGLDNYTGSPSFPGNEGAAPGKSTTGTPAGATVLLVARSLILSLPALSTGGKGGRGGINTTSGRDRGEQGFGGSGTGFCSLYTAEGGI